MQFGSSPDDFVELGAQYLGGMSNNCSIYLLLNQLGISCNLPAIDEPQR